jgi:AcrR family transcriptional regulator
MYPSRYGERMSKQLPTNSIPARPEITREFVLQHRRRRYAAAAAELLHEFGRPDLTVEMLVYSAGTARNSFYAVFENANDCLAFAVDDARERLLRPVRGTAEAGEWLPRLREAIAGFYAAVAEDPLGAELLLIHSFAVELGAERDGFEAAVGDLEHLLAGGRAAAAEAGPPSPPALAEEYWARAVLTGAAAALPEQDLARLPGLAAQLTDLIATCFLGGGPASRERGRAIALEH